MFIQERLKRLDFLAHSLHVGRKTSSGTRGGSTHLNFIQLIPSNNQLHSGISLTENLNPVSNFWITSRVNQYSGGYPGDNKKCLPLLQQGSDINPHRDGGDINKPFLSLNALRKCLEGQYPTDGLPERRGVSMVRTYAFWGEI